MKYLKYTTLIIIKIMIIVIAVVQLFQKIKFLPRLHTFNCLYKNINFHKNSPFIYIILTKREACITSIFQLIKQRALSHFIGG